MSKSNRNLIQPGMQFSRWTVLERSPENEKRWLCRCECGTERYVAEKSLRYGESKSCGCLRLENSRNACAHDLVGKVFGELTVTGKAEHQRENGGIWWHCTCSCGAEYEVPGTLLVIGKRTTCGGKIHEKPRSIADISGKRIGRLVALYPTTKRDSKGFVIWHCRCDCGNEVDVSYNCLLYSGTKSCGCQRKENDQELRQFLTHVDGTCINSIQSKKLPSDNTTGYRGVYFTNGKYIAKIVFQKRPYFLGTFSQIEDAAEARAEAEETLFGGALEFYAKWQKRAAEDPLWAEENPAKIEVLKDRNNRLQLHCFPKIL